MMIILRSLSALFPAPQSYRITFFITRGVHYIMNSWIVMACSKKLSFSTLIMNPKYFDQTNHAIKTQAQLSCPAKLSRQPYKFRHKSLRKYVGRIICIESWWPLFPTLEFYSHKSVLPALFFYRTAEPNVHFLNNEDCNFLSTYFSTKVGNTNQLCNIKKVELQHQLFIDFIC